MDTLPMLSAQEPESEEEVTTTEWHGLEIEIPNDEDDVFVRSPTKDNKTKPVVEIDNKTKPKPKLVSERFKQQPVTPRVMPDKLIPKVKRLFENVYKKGEDDIYFVDYAQIADKLGIKSSGKSINMLFDRCYGKENISPNKIRLKQKRGIWGIKLIEEPEPEEIDEPEIEEPEVVENKTKIVTKPKKEVKEVVERIIEKENPFGFEQFRDYMDMYSKEKEEKKSKAEKKRLEEEEREKQMEQIYFEKFRLNQEKEALEKVEKTLPDKMNHINWSVYRGL